MNPPTFITRFLGTPLVAFVLYIGCVMAVLGWTRGEVAWWLALAAVFFVATVRKAAQDVRQYKQWRAAWVAMGSASGSVAPMPIVRRNAPWIRITIAGLSLLIIPILITAPGADEALQNGLILLWLAIAAGLLWKFAVIVRRAFFRKGATIASTGRSRMSASENVVKWVLPPASSSPSRLDAIRNVPDYCARLMASH